MVMPSKEALQTFKRLQTVSIDFKNVTVIDMGWDNTQYPKFEDSFIIEAEFKDTGVALTDEQVEELNDNGDFVYEQLQDFLH
jgi:hypothetical protein